MQTHMERAAALFAVLATILACGGTSDPAGTSIADAHAKGERRGNLFSVGGTVAGLFGTLVLQDNGGDDLTLTADGAFTFATKLPNGSTYDVTVLTQPSGETCGFGPSGMDPSATGTISDADVTVAVSCSSSVQGTVATPTITPGGGTYYVDAWNACSYVGCMLTLSDDTPGTAIYYTVDGSDPAVDAGGVPTGSTKLYTTGQEIDLLNDAYYYVGTPITIKAIATLSGAHSDIAVGNYDVVWVF